jgi:fatty acid desaturase
MDVARKMLASLPQVAASKLTVEVPVQETSLGTKRDSTGVTVERTMEVPSSVDTEGFYAAVKQRVNSYFVESGLQSRGGPIMVIKSCVTLALLATAWYLACVEGHMWACPILGVLMAICGLSIQHDANHGALSQYPTVNWLFGMVDDLIGGSSLAWRHQHMVAHHADPNEFNNLAINPDARSTAVIERLRPLLRSKASGQMPTTPFNPARL